MSRTKVKKAAPDPIGDKRRKHVKHLGNGAIHHDCAECNPFADERTFLLMTKSVLIAALNVVFAANDRSIYYAHPWRRYQEEVNRRLDAVRDRTDTTRREDEDIINKLFKGYRAEIGEET